jgi:acetyl esterase/lipase
VQSDTAAIEPLSLVNPEFRAAIAKQPTKKQSPEMTWDDFVKVLPKSRKAISEATHELQSPEISKTMIPGAKGAPDVPVYVINADAKKHRPAILHMHGGGFIVGSAAQALKGMLLEAKELDCVAVTVDYRLAPETPFPGPLEDSYAALKWLYTNAESLGVDQHKIAIQGESAGGGLAAILAIAARDRGEVPILFQALIYPMLDDRTATSIQPPSYIGTFGGWTREYNRLAWRAFLGQMPGESNEPDGAVPARLKSLRGLPPTFIGVGSLDLFVQEDIEYAKRLIEAGVPTELVVVPGGFHGFDNQVPNAPLSKQFMVTQYKALAQAFAQAKSDKPKEDNKKSNP